MIQDSTYGDSSVWSALIGRSVAIAEFEHSTDNRSSTRLESIKYPQQQGARQAGFTSESFQVSGIYTGPLSDNYQVTVATDSGFNVIYGDPDTDHLHEAASGSFSMYIGNGDLLSITVLPLAPVNDFFLADLTHIRADGSAEALSSIPFFRFAMEEKPFADIKL